MQKVNIAVDRFYKTIKLAAPNGKLLLFESVFSTNGPYCFAMVIDIE